MALGVKIKCVIFSQKCNHIFFFFKEIMKMKFLYGPERLTDLTIIVLG